MSELPKGSAVNGDNVVPAGPRVEKNEGRPALPALGSVLVCALGGYVATTSLAFVAPAIVAFGLVSCAPRGLLREMLPGLAATIAVCAALGASSGAVVLADCAIACLAALAVAVAGMIWILWTVVSRGAAVISLEFLTEPSKPFGAEDSGIANALLGTLAITLGAALIGIPPAVLGGIYLAEFGRNTRVGNLIRFAANVMMGMPSVVVGLFVYAVLVIPLGTFSGFAGSVALAILMVPVVLRTTEDMLLMVPDSLRESALALGTTRARASLQIICRSARGGLEIRRTTAHISAHSTHSTAFPGRKPHRAIMAPKTTAPMA